MMLLRLVAGRSLRDEQINNCRYELLRFASLLVFVCSVTSHHVVPPTGCSKILCGCPCGCSNASLARQASSYSFSRTSK